MKRFLYPFSSSTLRLDWLDGIIDQLLNDIKKVWGAKQFVSTKNGAVSMKMENWHTYDC